MVVGSQEAFWKKQGAGLHGEEKESISDRLRLWESWEEPEAGGGTERFPQAAV